MNLKQLLWPDVSPELWQDWKWQLKNRLQGEKGLERLEKACNISTSSLKKVISTYKWASTPYYLSLIDSDELLADPIAKQAIPAVEEVSFNLEDSSKDPLAEGAHSPLPGLIHRYEDRVVLLASGVCASYCRHCNRKRTWSNLECLSLNDKSLLKVKNYLQSNKQIREVIVSGGDPLLLQDSAIEKLLSTLRSIPNIEVLRIGTRVPVVLPMRVTDELCTILKRHRPIWLNTHFNHPREITKDAQMALEKIQLAGVPVSNQTVLLKGINDDFQTLKTLFYRLQASLVRPYYLFQCDHVKGTDHFRTPLSTGINIIEKMWGHMGGMCVPNLVADLPGGMGKARLLPSHLLETGDKFAIFRTFEGKIVKIQMV